MSHINVDIYQIWTEFNICNTYFLRSEKRPKRKIHNWDIGTPTYYLEMSHNTFGIGISYLYNGQDWILFRNIWLKWRLRQPLTLNLDSYFPGACITKAIWHYWWDLLANGSTAFNCHFVVPLLLRNSGNKPQDNTPVRALITRCNDAYLISFLTWDNEPINDNQKDSIHTSLLCFTLPFSITMMS